MKTLKYMAALFLLFVSAPTWAQTVLFEDHFDSPVLSPEWVSIRPSQWIQDGWLHTTDTGPGRDSFAVVQDGNPLWTDYTYEVTADGLLSMGGLVEDFDILFRTSNVTWAQFGVHGNYYRLGVFQRWNGGQAVGLSKVTGSTGTTLFESRSLPNTKNPMRVRVAASGPRIQVFFDGEKVIDVVDGDNPHLFGGIGIGAIWESEARFDDVVVTAGARVHGVVNNLVSFASVSGTQQFTTNLNGCPADFAGIFSFDALLTNISTETIIGPFYAPLLADVVTLSDGNLLKNGVYGPRGVVFKHIDQADGFVDGELSPGESVNVPFEICLQERKAFQFLVDVWGMIANGQ